MKKFPAVFFVCLAGAVCAGAAQIPDEEIAKVFGRIRFVYDWRETHDYSVQVLDGPFADLNVARQKYASFATNPGEWYIVEDEHDVNYGFEDFIIYVVQFPATEWVDFTIRFDDLFPGL